LLFGDQKLIAESISAKKNKPAVVAAPPTLYPSLFRSSSPLPASPPTYKEYVHSQRVRPSAPPLESLPLPPQGDEVCRYSDLVGSPPVPVDGLGEMEGEKEKEGEELGLGYGGGSRYY